MHLPEGGGSPEVSGSRGFCSGQQCYTRTSSHNFSVAHTQCQWAHPSLPSPWKAKSLQKKCCVKSEAPQKLKIARRHRKRLNLPAGIWMSETVITWVGAWPANWDYCRNRKASILWGVPSKLWGPGVVRACVLCFAWFLPPPGAQWPLAEKLLSNWLEEQHC